MPYKTRKVGSKTCVYKKRGGKKVGCTSGPVKKYLGALYANEASVPSFKDFYDTKKLRVFDFDDTLFTTAAHVYVTRAGKEFKLTPAEYAIFKPKPDDKLDFREFDRVIDPKPIKRTIGLLYQILTAPDTERRKTLVLTARGEVQEIRDLLHRIFRKPVEVVGVGTSDPYAKKAYIEKQIQDGYNDVFFIDDSPKNVAAVKELEKEYPNVKFKIVQAQHSI